MQASMGAWSRHGRAAGGWGAGMPGPLHRNFPQPPSPMRHACICDMRVSAGCAEHPPVPPDPGSRGGPRRGRGAVTHPCRGGVVDAEAEAARSEAAAGRRAGRRQRHRGLPLVAVPANPPLGPRCSPGRCCRQGGPRCCCGRRAPQQSARYEAGRGQRRQGGKDGAWVCGRVGWVTGRGVWVGRWVVTVVVMGPATSATCLQQWCLRSGSGRGVGS